MIFTMTEQAPTRIEIPAVVELPAQVSMGVHSIAPDTTAEQDRASASQRLAERTTAPTTTEEDDRRTASQRAINLKWEDTQSKVALAVCGVSLAIAGGLAMFGKWLGTGELQLASVVFLYGVANLVIGFYFGRTNHQRTGGVESPYQQPYQGR